MLQVKVISKRNLMVQEWTIVITMMCGHTRDTFNLHGFPDRYKDLKQGNLNLLPRPLLILQILLSTKNKILKILKTENHWQG